MELSILKSMSRDEAHKALMESDHETILKINERMQLTFYGCHTHEQHVNRILWALHESPPTLRQIYLNR